MTTITSKTNTSFDRRRGMGLLTQFVLHVAILPLRFNDFYGTAFQGCGDVISNARPQV